MGCVVMSMQNSRAMLGRQLLTAIGGKLRSDENRGRWICRVARICGLSIRTVEGVWHRQYMSDETEKILHAAALRFDLRLLDAAREFEELASQYERLDALSGGRMGEFYRRLAAETRAQAHREARIAADGTANGVAAE